MSNYWARVGIRFVLVVTVVLRVAAVLLAVQYVGLSYELGDVYSDLLSGVRWLMPNFLWCVLWWQGMPALTDWLASWLETDEEESTATVSGVHTVR